MGKKEQIEEKTWALLAAPCEELGLKPVDAEYVRNGGDYQLMIYIDKEGGVTIDDCEALSRAIDPLLDSEDYIHDAYTMIVSSPGLGRAIKRPRDFIFAKGKEVDVRLYQAKDGSKEFTGILTDFDDTSIWIQEGDTETVFLKKEVAAIHLTVDF